MPAEITMPQQSDTMTEGTVVKWLKKEGDQVKSGDIIAEIETDKATMEMESFDSGTLAAILVIAPMPTRRMSLRNPLSYSSRRRRSSTSTSITRMTGALAFRASTSSSSMRTANPTFSTSPQMGRTSRV